MAKSAKLVNLENMKGMNYLLVKLYTPKTNYLQELCSLYLPLLSTCERKYIKNTESSHKLRSINISVGTSMHSQR